MLGVFFVLEMKLLGCLWHWYRQELTPYFNHTRNTRYFTIFIRTRLSSILTNVSWFLQACNTCAVRVERKRKRKLIEEQEDAAEAASPPKKSRSGRTIKVPRRFSKGAEGRQMWRRSLCAKGLWGGGGMGERGVTQDVGRKEGDYCARRWWWAIKILVSIKADKSY